jgi:predicted  nucleic acid-binding Zn-ribbon protein
MLKWKNLPSDPEVLKERLQKLRDKEVKLEADLAIKDQPELEEGITHVVLAMYEVRKLDSAIRKSQKPATPEDRRAVDALVKQIQFYKSKLAAAEQGLKERGGSTAEKYAVLHQHRARAANQLLKIFDETHDVFSGKGINLTNLLPSVKDLLEGYADYFSK